MSSVFDRRPVVLSLLLAASGCSRWGYWSAERLERQGRLPEAAASYRDFAYAHPGDARAREALWRAARLFGPALGKCELARPIFEELARSGQGPEAERARIDLMDCPSYFPMGPGSSWVLVDPQTGGRNMRQEVTAFRGGGPAEGRLETKLYAGRKLFSTIKRTYVKGGWKVKEYDAKTKSGVAILRYPFKAGESWTETRAGRPVTFRIADDAAVVRTRAGRFEGCLKVVEQVEGLPSWKADYYAPGIGRVLTSAGSGSHETPTTELLSSTVHP